jgi:hypothetical protein
VLSLLDRRSARLRRSPGLSQLRLSRAAAGRAQRPLIASAMLMTRPTEGVCASERGISPPITSELHIKIIIAELRRATNVVEGDAADGNPLTAMRYYSRIERRKSTATCGCRLHRLDAMHSVQQPLRAVFAKRAGRVRGAAVAGAAWEGRHPHGGQGPLCSTKSATE